MSKAQIGEDPAGNRRESKPRVFDLAERHLTEHSAIHKKAKSVLKDRQLWEARILPHLGKRKVADIHRRDIAKLMNDMVSTPALANKVRTMLGKAFNLAEMSCGVNNGQTLAVVGQLLGHRKILTTQRYAHLADDPVREAAEVIGENLAGSLDG